MCSFFHGSSVATSDSFAADGAAFVKYGTRKYKEIDRKKTRERDGIDELRTKVTEMSSQIVKLESISVLQCKIFVSRL